MHPDENLTPVAFPKRGFGEGTGREVDTMTRVN